ncbi:MAG: aminopeptidase P N-terminal domain-containing protein [bacterium]
MFKRHRRALMEQMKDAVAVFFSARETLRNNDVHFEYRQGSDFFHLTGFEEPESVLVLAPHREAGDQTFLFLRQRDPEREVWDGKRLGVEAAPAALGIDKAFPIEQLAQKLPGLLVGAGRQYHHLGECSEDDVIILDALKAARRLRKRGDDTPGDVLDPAELLHEHRLLKSPAAIEQMQQAATLTARGHRLGMAVTRPGLFEYQLQAAMEYSWRVGGARREAYPSIVGSGPNACVLHYRENNRRLEAGDLVLVDAGCEFGYHASDVTRTWPVNGRFSDPQRAIYEVVLNAQLAAIDHCRAGHAFDAVHQVAVRVLTEGMCDLGLLKGPVKERIEDEGYKRYYMHRTGHWLGMDVHDVGRYYLRGTSRALEPGMVLTVEPGIYIAPDDDQAPEAFRGIGVRIEDDVLVTEGAPRVLTDEAPKTVAEVEAVIGTADLPR